MATTIGNISDFIKSNGMTGNSLIDTIIVTSLIPFILAWVKTIFDTFSDLIKKLLSYIWEYGSEKITSRMLGDVICNMHLSQSDPVFNSLNELLRSTKKHPEEYTGNFVEKLIKISNSFSTSSFVYKKRNDTFYINTNSHPKNLEDIFVINEHWGSGTEEEKIKVFYTEDIYIIFKYSKKITETTAEAHTHESINIKLISFTTKNYTPSQISKIMKTFLINKLNIHKILTYTYFINTTNSTISTFISFFLDPEKLINGTHRLNYGDGVFETSENELIEINNNKFHLDFKTSNADISNLKNELVFQNKNQGIDTNTTFSTLYKKYFPQSNLINLLSSTTGLCGYFFDDNCIYFIASQPYTIAIVSKGKILTNNAIMDKIAQILNQGIENRDKKGNQKVNKSPLKDAMYLYKYTKDDWNKYQLDSRDFETIYLPSDTINGICKEMNNFTNLSKLYKSCSIPYRKGLLFYGPPGTGKTSLVKALAYMYQMNIYTININDDFVNDDTISGILNGMSSSRNKILLFEDIDTAFSDKEKIKNETRGDTINIDTKDALNRNSKFLTYSGLLNALDGVLTNHHGVITIMTTNNIEKLGAAFLRPGRIDRKFLLAECDREQISKMSKSIIKKYLSILKETDGTNKNLQYEDDIFLQSKLNVFIKNIVDNNGKSKFTPSKLQVYLLRFIENIDDIFNNYEELL